MINTLMVPVHLDALCLENDELMVEAMANFARLPYSDGERDLNPDTANISEDIVVSPFQDLNLYLKAGIHLHWALPDALTVGDQTPDGTVFPVVPNRWAVIRSRNGSVEKRWVIESDYLYPEGAGELSGSVNIPVLPKSDSEQSQPFRYIGRKMTLEAWQNKDPGAEYLDRLTAVAYGESSFAAFYPNCHSVFGLHDDDYSGDVPDDLQYDLLGWYSDPAQDHLKNFLEDYRNSYQQQRLPDDPEQPDNDATRQAVEESLRWTLAIALDQQFPEQILCYARLKFEPQPEADQSAGEEGALLSLTVANTGTEALSAYLAQTIDGAWKSVIEDQLEALQLSFRLDHRRLDVGPKFREARHEKSFTGIEGSTVWTIRPEADSPSPADSSSGQEQLPEEMAEKLNSLNSVQQSYDQKAQEIESMRKQLFSDWYKYMVCVYPPEATRDEFPDPDEVRNFIEVKGISPLQKEIARLGDLTLKTDEADRVTGALAAGSTLASELANSINDLLVVIEDFNTSDAVKESQKPYRLKQTPGPRYWRPADPVVLITGDAATPSKRYGQDGRLSDDGLLECQMLSSDAPVQEMIPDRINEILSRVDEIMNEGENIGFISWTSQPWNPIFLEWEVEVLPTTDLGNTEPETGNYSTEFITANYTIVENDTDFSLQAGKGAVTKGTSVYSGFSILSPHASNQVNSQIEDYLNREVLQDFYRDQQIPPEQQTDDFLSENIARVQSWYESQNASSLDTDEGKANDPVYTALRAYSLLLDLDCLSQALGGFNEALIMHRQTLQLEIDDPLGFDDYVPFTDTVRELVQKSNHSAPQPLSDFNPIRSGAMKIRSIRLVDSFGQVKEIDPTRIITTEQMAISGSSDLVSLPPRLAEPSRLNFRWLSATGDQQEMNDLPATTPICGWILPNNLDWSLMFYDSQGKMLGLIDERVIWEPAPGDDTPDQVEDIKNPHLRKVVEFLRARSKSFFQNFIITLNTALENIDPENAAQHQDIALLMGQPVAVVRASINLELQGLPSIHQGWNAFRQDLRRNTRDTNNFTRVEIPIRLGEFQQLNDGLVGYWKEDGDGYEDDLYFTPQSDPLDDENIWTHDDGPLTIFQTVDGPPQLLTMLVDPRGLVHATCGVSPVKSISIPPDQYTPALEAIEVTFPSAPILTDVGQINLALPAEAGYQWAWLEKQNGQWAQPVTSIGKVNAQATFSAKQEVREGWLRLSRAASDKGS
jgi:hypothetical protein